MTVYVDPDDSAMKRRVRQREAARRYREANRERVRANARAQYARNKESRRESHARWRESVKDDPKRRDKDNALARKSYSKRVDAESLRLSGRVKPVVCDVCKDFGRICLDHDHETGMFRGWLCNHCNLVLGHAKDSPDRLRALANYLETPIGSLR